VLEPTTLTVEAAISDIGAAIFGCGGTRLSDDEISFFKEANPAGLILFSRNIESPDQLTAIIGEMKSLLGRDHLAVLVDQEGGRVQRLGPPHWRKLPPMGVFGELYKKDANRAEAALRANTDLLAAQLRSVGITVNCLPVLDVPVAGGDNIIGDRAFCSDPQIIAKLGSIVCDTLNQAGILPVLKHIPGHGRAGVDSHKSLPVVEATLEQLKATDFAPFCALSGALLAMTAHVIYSAVDPDNPATFSSKVIDEIIRSHMGFEGLLMSDDLSMNALGDALGGALGRDFGSRAKRAIAAGCDIILHCNGNMAEMTAVAENAGTILPTRYNLLKSALIKGAQARQDP
jgi:beta-N-acetylhexosaminidase